MRGPRTGGANDSEGTGKERTEQPQPGQSGLASWGRWQDLTGQLSEGFKSLGKTVVLMQLGRPQTFPSSTLE